MVCGPPNRGARRGGETLAESGRRLEATLTRRNRMSTVRIVIIVVVVLIVVALLVSAASKRKRTEQLARTQVQAKQHDVDHHREQAHDARTEAQLAEERATRAGAAAELNEHKAAARAKELGER